MKRFLCSIIPAWILILALAPQCLAAQLLIPGGKLVALELSDGSVTVAAFDDALGQAARDAGLQVGDIIRKVNGTPVTSTEEVRRAMEHCDSNAELIVARGQKQYRIVVAPPRISGQARLGIYLRDGIAGIGTITYYDPENRTFGTLGHGVSSAAGELLVLKNGFAYDGTVRSVVKGKCGTAGQLRGTLAAPDPIATLDRNTPCGVFGTLARPILGEPLPVAQYSDIALGPATIRSTVENDTVQEYSVEILKIYPQDKPDHRNFLLKVTDDALLRTTGGIVQGMSGSPIIQNGKLIGAVTHVLVNDPTTGYGIFIENMLEASS